MNRAVEQFESNLESARQLGVIYSALCDNVTEAVRLDEILRAEIVLAVSALDCYVHDVVRIGMTKTLALTSGEPNAYLNFGVSMQVVKRLLRASSADDKAMLFDQEVRRLHGFKTFQTADSISQAFGLLGIAHLWDKIGDGLGILPSDVKVQLNLLVGRRNAIAHEGDIDPSSGIGTKYPIDLPTVQQSADFLDSLVHQMQAVVLAEMTH